MENIPSTMVPHKHVYGVDTIFATMSGPLANNLLGKWIGLIRRGTYQAAYEYIRWAYEPVSDLWPDIEPDGDSIDGGSRNEGIKYQENLEDQEQEEVVLVTQRNPRRLRQGDQISLRHLKSESGSSKDKLFFIKRISTGSTQSKWYLVQVDMGQSDPIEMRYYGVYRCRW